MVYYGPLSPSTLDDPAAVTARQPIISDSRRALIEQRLRRRMPPSTSQPNIPLREDRGKAPLSSGQQRMWFVTELLPGSAVYNTPLALRLKGNLNVAALLSALDGIVQRHEILRTRFTAEGGTPVQVIGPARPVPFSETDLTSVPAADREAALQKALNDECARPLDITSDLMVRAALIRMGPFDQVLTLLVHHIASDLWSWELFFQELAQLYDAQLSGAAAQLPALPVQYADYAAWERGRIEQSAHAEALDYWRQKLAGAPDLLELPVDRPRPPTMGFKGAALRQMLPRELGAALRRVSRIQEATLFMTMMAAFKVLLHRMTHQTDLVVGIPTAGRTQPQTEHLIGLFVNTLALRSDLSGDPKFTSLLQQVKATSLDALRHQELPFDRLVEELRPVRDPSYLPLVQVMFTLQNAMDLNVRLSELTAALLPIDPGTARFDLTLVAEESGLDLEVVLEYNTDLFEEVTARRILARYQKLLEEVAKNPDRTVGELPILPEDERQLLLQEWNRTGKAYDGPSRLHELFEAQVRATPHNEALVAGTQRFTYVRLNRRADRVARRLRSLGVGPESRVAIFLPRTADLVVAMLGVLKAGAAYVAMDPAYPAERLAFIVEDCQATVVLTQTSLLSALPASLAQTICIDAESTWAKLRANRKLWLRLTGSPAAQGQGQDLAYIIYTSGSTGRPKGVALEHRNAVAFVHWAHDAFSARELSGVLAGTSICFDLSVFELFAPLCRGGKVILAENALALPGLAARREVRLINAVPSVMEELLRLGGIPNTVETVNLAGEPLPTHLVQKLYALPHVKRVYDLYGPTETTTYSTYALREPNGRATIGRPLANTRLYLLGPRDEPVPIGVSGELYIGGAGVARGYLDRPDLTAARFLRDPFSPDPAARMYRTGDVCRYRPDGNLEYVGRADQQVKIRGFRVEPGEIEAVLLAHPLVAETVVAPREDPETGRRLIAYVVPKPGAAIDAADLRGFLHRKLPVALIPAGFIALGKIPRTANGKIDRRALPAPGTLGITAAGERTAPRNPIEAKLVEVWQSVLNVSPIGIHDRFFDLGGHSLLAVRLIAQIETFLGRKLPVAAIFRAPTVEQLAVLIADANGTEAKASLLAVQPKGTRPPLFLVHGMGGGIMWGYANLSRHLGEDQPVYAFRACDPEKIPDYDTIEKMAGHYVADLRRFQPQGPYQIGGYCFGGTVAFEMARQLEAQGQTVRLLALMNSWPPNFGQDRMPRTLRGAGHFLINLGGLITRFRQWGAGGRRQFIRWKVRALKLRIVQLCSRRRAPTVPEAELAFDLAAVATAERELWQAHLKALNRYRPGPWSGHVTLLRTAGYPLFCSFDRSYGWSGLAGGGVTVRMVPGWHETLMVEPHVADAARELQRHLPS